MKETKCKKIIESLIFSSPNPISLKQIRDFFSNEDLSELSLQNIINEIQISYENSGVQLVKVSSGYRFQVSEDCNEWVSNFYPEKPQKYSRALMETLALIIYRQPITRTEIEAVRGVGVSSNIIKTLLEREWIKILGYKDAPGKPAIFGTTKEFLNSHNLVSLNQLPKLDDISEFSELEKRQLGLLDNEQLDSEQRSVFATLSAKVGSISDNGYGGWYSYRASKAALNQLIKTASIEMKIKNKNAIFVALHPGTVDSDLSKPFQKSNLKIQTPRESAINLIKIIKNLKPAETGKFFNWDGLELPW